MHHIRTLYNTATTEGNFTQELVLASNSMTVLKSRVPATIDWQTERDPAFSHFMNLTTKKFSVDYTDRSLEFTILDILLNTSAEHFPPEVIRNLSRVNKHFWNNCSNHFEVAFPENEELPREEKVALDVYYIPTSAAKIHRLALSRAHESTLDTETYYVCFLDREVVYIIRKIGRTKTIVLFDNEERWTFTNSPGRGTLYTIRTCSLMFDNVNLLVHQEDYGSSLFNFGYFPNKFYVFVNNRCTMNGQHLNSHKKVKKVVHCFECLLYTSYFILLPLFILVGIFVVCLKAGFVRKKFTIRKYWLPLGAFKHVKITNSQLKELNLFTTDNNDNIDASEIV